MNRPAECIACLINSRTGDLREAGLGEEAYYHTLLSLSNLILKSRTRAFSESFRVIAEASGKNDPYWEKKQVLNSLAQRVLELIEGEEMREEDLLRLGAAANSFDTSVLGYEFNPESFSLEKLQEPLAIDETGKIVWEKIGTIAYVLDNSGEAVIDAFIITKLSELGYRVLAVAREDPYEIDVTATELEKILGKGAEILKSMGNLSPLYALERDTLVGKRLREADLIIAKGIANLEGYIDSGRWLKDKAFFLLRAKCPVIARAFEVQKGSPIAIMEETAWKNSQRIKWNGVTASV
jgi:uncharacterized protein with ATP-grasp and redox domains